MSAKIIALEGLDCAFKETNASKLLEYFEDRTLSVSRFSFPNYDSQSSYFVKQYLSGAYAKNPMDINPLAASLFFALDRYDTYMSEIKEHYDNDDVIIFDRYVGSNIMYQATKLDEEWQADKLISHIRDIEHTLLGLPIEDLTIFLSVPFDISMELVKKKNNVDIHENNIEYEKRIYDYSNRIATVQGYEKVECVENGKLLSKDEIFNKIINLEKFKKIMEEIHHEKN